MSDMETQTGRIDARIDWSKVGPGDAGRLSAESRVELLLNQIRTGRRPGYLFAEADTEAFNDLEVVAEAERIVDHFLLGHQFGPEVDWHYNATSNTSKDSEWTWSLARNGYWIPLARAYRITGDERFAREFVAQLKSFYGAWPVTPHMDQTTANMSFPGDAWRSIEAGIRIYTVWLPALVYFRSSPSWDTEGWLIYLNAICDHAEFLTRHYSNHQRCSNWLTMESTALFQIGVLFPEFKDAKQWKDAAFRRICHEVRYQFDQDGVHIERTPIYHLVSEIAFLQAYRVATKNGIRVPPYMLPVLENGAEFLMRLVKPDFTIPMIGDADRVSLTSRVADTSPYEGMNLTTDPIDLNEVRAFFRVMAKLTGRDDFLYFATGRTQGQPPAKKNFAMRESGYYVFRSGWSATDSYFLVTGVQVERGSLAHHTQKDALHLELVIDGQDVLVDTGRFVYDNCSWLDWAAYFQSTRAHNTIGVDGRNMGDLPDTPPTVRGIRSYCHRVDDNDTLACVELSHNGWSFLEEPVFHRRRVLWLKPDVWLVDDMVTGAGSHVFSLYFNFAEGKVEADDSALTHRFISGDSVITCEPLIADGLTAEVFDGSEDPKAGWISYGYSIKHPIPQLVFTRTGATPQRFVTAFFPSERAVIESVQCGTPDEVVVSLHRSDEKLTICLAEDDYRVDVRT